MVNPHLVPRVAPPVQCQTGGSGGGEAGFARSAMSALRDEHATLGLRNLGDPDILTCMARAAPVCFKTICLVCRDAQAAANAPALEMLAEARAMFNRLTAEVHPIDVATLSTLQYEYSESGSDSGSDSDLDHPWERDTVEQSFDEANSELFAHQGSVWLARELLLTVQGRAGFLTSARSMLHAGALVILHIAWSAEDLRGALSIAYVPRDLSLDDSWEDWRFLVSTSRLIDRGQWEADLQAAYARHGISPELRVHIDRSWRDKEALLTACERAGLTAPPDCDSWDHLQRDAPRAIEEARRGWTLSHKQRGGGLGSSARRLHARGARRACTMAFGRWGSVRGPTRPCSAPVWRRPIRCI